MTRLVLLPGLDGTGELFVPFIEALAGAIETEVIAYPPDRAMTYAEHEAFVRAKLPRDGGYVLLAESFSGPIGISIATSAPPGLEGLILCVTFASNPVPIFGPLSRLIGALPAARVPPALMAPWLYAGNATPELRRAYARAMSRVLPSTIRARVAALLAVDHRHLMRRIAVPIMYMRANADRLVPASAGRAILELRPDVHIVEFDAPHFLLQTAPLRCAADVMSFVRRRVLARDDVPEAPDPPLNVQQALLVAQLTQQELQEIDRVLLQQAAHSFRKVARVVGGAMSALPARIPGIPDVYYAQRVRNLVAQGLLESQGNLAYMRYSEVRLPAR
jgi:pimeloyl-ACP methyl ester carboxylesterase